MTSSPVVGADGSVYVVAETRVLIAGETSVYRYESTLHKFSAGGGWLYQAPFPQRWGNTKYSSRGDANAAPNIWSSNGVEAIIVPAVYSIPAYTSLRLAASATSGAVLGDVLVSEPSPGTVTGDWLPPWSFDVPSEPPSCTDFSVCLPTDTSWPLSDVAIWQSDKGEPPTVMVSDALQDVVGYTFDPAQGFTERFRVHDANRRVSSGPLILPDGHTVVTATSDKSNRLTFAGPNFTPAADSTGNLGVAWPALPGQHANFAHARCRPSPRSNLHHIGRHFYRRMTGDGRTERPARSAVDRRSQKRISACFIGGLRVVCQRNARSSLQR